MKEKTNVEAYRAAGERMNGIGLRIEQRDDKYHTGGRKFLDRVDGLMKA